MNIPSQQDDWSRGRKEGKVIHNNIWKTLAWIFISVTANLAWQPWWLTLFFRRFPTLEMTNRSVVPSTALNVSRMHQFLGPHANNTGTTVPFYSFPIDITEVFTRISSWILECCTFAEVGRQTYSRTCRKLCAASLSASLALSLFKLQCWSYPLVNDCYIFSWEITKVILKWLIHLIFDGYKSTPVINFFGW